MGPMIETSNLTKRYGKFTAVNAVNLSVNKGEIYGFLGLNGAGKTTTIRMLLGMISPTSGDAWLQGKKVCQTDHSLWNSIGYMVETPYAYPELTVRENLEMFRKLRLIPDSNAVNHVMARLKLTVYQDRLAKHLSLGNAQRLGLAKALLHYPEILILDEPANGLDPAGIVETRELLLDLAHNQGVTIFISSHILGEVAKFATRIAIIHQAKLIQEMDTDKLEAVLQRRLLIEVEHTENAMNVLKKEGFKPSLNNEGMIEVKDVAAVEHPEKLNALLVKSNHLASMLRVAEEDLESYFLRMISTHGGEQ